MDTLADCTLQDLVDLMDDLWDDLVQAIKDEDHEVARSVIPTYNYVLDEIHRRGFICYTIKGETKTMDLSCLY